MLKNLFLKILILNSLTFLFSNQIPLNSLNSPTLNNWIIIKDKEIGPDKHQSIIENHSSYIDSSKQKIQVDLEPQKNIPIQAYQLFDNLTIIQI